MLEREDFLSKARPDKRRSKTTLQGYNDSLGLKDLSVAKEALDILTGYENQKSEMTKKWEEEG